MGSFVLAPSRSGRTYARRPCAHLGAGQLRGRPQLAAAKYRMFVLAVARATVLAWHRLRTACSQRLA